MDYLPSGSRPANLGGAEGFEHLTSTEPGGPNEAGRTYRSRTNERLSRPHAGMFGAGEPSIWDTRQCHRPRSFMRMLAEPRRRRDGRWCGRAILGYLAVSPTVRSFSAPVGLRSQQRPTPRNRSLDGVSAVDPTGFPRRRPWPRSPHFRCRQSRKSSLSSLGSCSAPTGTWRHSTPRRTNS